MYCAAVARDVYEGLSGSEGGARSASCSEVCEAENFQVQGDLTGD